MQVTVGRIGRPHGVRGDVVVSVRTDDPRSRFAPGTRLGTDPDSVGPLTVLATRWQSGDLIVRFTGITDRAAAAGLRGAWLLADSVALAPPASPDEFRDADLVGLSVKTVAGVAVGTVGDVLHSGQDVLVIRPAGSGPDILVPFVKAIVTEVDVAGGVMVIDPPLGLLNLEDAL